MLYSIRFSTSSQWVLTKFSMVTFLIMLPRGSTKFPIDAFVMLLIVTTNTHTHIWECPKLDGFIFVNVKSKEPIIPKELSTCITN